MASSSAKTDQVSSTAEGGSDNKASPKSFSTAGFLAKAWLKQYFHDSNFPEWTKSHTGITVALSFPERPASLMDKERPVCCLLCDLKFLHPSGEQDILKHLMEAHKFVIGDVHMIADLPSYVAYWKHKFDHSKVDDFVTTMKMKLEGEGEEEKDFYFLSDILSEDKELRIHLQMRKLEHVLEVQEKERKDTDFERSCFFCRTHFKGSHSKLLDHMAFDHNFSVGQPDNLVYVSELLDLLEAKLEHLVCIFCEKTFKSRDVLKEHMRKKNHKKINPSNKIYDKFYLVNYLEFGKSWEEVRRESDQPFFEDEELPTGFDSDTSDSALDNDWSDWRGDLSGAVCLFCSAVYTDVKDMQHHMTVVHDFDYAALKTKLGLNFYQQIKLVNYIRRQMHLNVCLYCCDKFKDKEALFEHMKAEEHMKTPEEREEWDQPQYFFPTYENDNFLFCLEDDDDDDQQDEGLPRSMKNNKGDEEPPVIPEEIPVEKDSILFKDEFRRELMPKHPQRKRTNNVK